MKIENKFLIKKNLKTPTVQNLNSLDKERLDNNFRWPSHSGVSKAVTNHLNQYILAVELQIERKNGAKRVTGHIDILLIVGDTLYVVDYKPDGHGDQMTNPLSPTYKHLSSSFIQSIPQVAAYAKILKKAYGVSKVVCVTFNKDSAWVYQDSFLENKMSLLWTVMVFHST
ncbi:hypothetical protein LCGC14_2044510 [marine sediment metagenome]|uniref:PD-(D/E)XK endonuclease-like domain-containing protein n=1 Tax=marine sediment metagenome TaxID=412755 RepID=A0A0F9FDF3_9ZZZZ